MRKRFGADIKAQVVQEVLKEEKTIAQIASEHSVHPSQLNTCRVISLHGLPSLFSRDHKAADMERAAHEKQVSLIALYLPGIAAWCLPPMIA